MGTGFFKLPKKAKRRTGTRKARTPRAARLTCGESCTLLTGCHSPKMPHYGKGRHRLLIMAEAPGSAEDAQGVPLVGGSGALLRQMMRRAGLNMDMDCWRTNAIRCRPPNNRTPTGREIKTCKEFWLREVQELKPRVVLLVGNVALTAWMDGRWRKELGGISRWRGYAVPDYERGCWFVATYHPAFLLRRGKTTDPATLQVQDDIKLVARLAKQKSQLPKMIVAQDCIKRLMEPREIIECLRSIKAGDRITIDYETTGIKPHAEGHRIVTCAVSPSVDGAWAFPMNDGRVQKTVARLMANPDIEKIAANIAFENEWSRVILGVEPRNWIWDTVLAAHILDNRPNITSVKFQAARRWGIFDYNKSVAKFLESKEDGANAFNTIDKAPMDDLLLYCGMDALLEHRLAYAQMRELER